MVSPFYVKPETQTSDILSGLSTIQEARRVQREQQAKQAAIVDDIQKAFASNDPLQIVRVSMKYPQFQKVIDSTMQMTKDAQHQDAQNYMQSVLANPAQAESLTQQRLQMLQQGGRDSTQTQQFLGEIQQDPQAAMKNLENLYALRYPKSYKSFREAQGTSDLGAGGFAKIDPSKYTPESVAEFQKSGDYSVLQPTSAQDLSPEEVVAAGLPKGTIAQRNPDGSLRVIEKPSDQTEPKITSDQRLSAGFAQRLADSNDVINQIGQDFTGATSSGAGFLPNVMKSTERQNFEQAKRNFINATLRKESGAAIAPSEFESADQQYFPQPGDSPEVLSQKQRNREVVMENLKLEAGPAYQQLVENLSKKDQPKNTVTIKGKDYQVGAIVENAKGQKGRINPDGTVTLL